MRWGLGPPRDIPEVRKYFIESLAQESFVRDKTGCRMVELVGASFLADEFAIFGTPNRDYIDREMAWYLTQSLNINDIPGEPPAMWKAVASPEGQINSNYGWVVLSEANWYQYRNVLEELKKNPVSRRAVMIYQRPSMWRDYKLNGMNDFMCTNAHQYFLRRDDTGDMRLSVVVQMRSNDVVFGYKNDYAWAKHVQYMLARDLGVHVGYMTWQVGSLHVYERHFHLVK